MGNIIYLDRIKGSTIARCESYYQLYNLLGPNILNEIVRSYTMYEGFDHLSAEMTCKAARYDMQFRNKYDEFMFSVLRGAIELTLIATRRKANRV